eukprot:jgi/Galph1/4805/GphlegSOOS_G3498.1
MFGFINHNTSFTTTFLSSSFVGKPVKFCFHRKRVVQIPLVVEAARGARWKAAKWAAKKRPRKLRPSDKFRKPPPYAVDPIRALENPPPSYSLGEKTSLTALSVKRPNEGPSDE